MKPTHDPLFPEHPFPHGMRERIVGAVHNTQVRIARTRMVLLGGISILATASIPSVFGYLSQESIQSGFSDYASLMLTDDDVVLVHWKDFILTLTESLPLTGLILLFSMIFLILWTLPRAVAAGEIALSQQRHVLSS